MTSTDLNLLHNQVLMSATDKSQRCHGQVLCPDACFAHPRISACAQLGACNEMQHSQYLPFQSCQMPSGGVTSTVVPPGGGEAGRVTLKVDVSYTDHSYMIGVGGNNSKQLAAQTSCHIHFPDCNKQSECDKSNCVTLAGLLPDVEYARLGIRLLQPLVLCITLPQPHPLHCYGTLRDVDDVPYPWKQYIELVEKNYAVKVTTKARSSNQLTAIYVKGSEGVSADVQAATEVLVHELVRRHFPYEQCHVTNVMEVSTHHHQIVQGNIKLIMQQSGAVVLFPDADDHNISSAKRGSVTITGSVRAVYTARQMLIGCLPVRITFELLATGAVVSCTSGQMPASVAQCLPHSARMRRLQLKHDVCVCAPQRSRDGLVLLTLMAMERNVVGLYRARAELLYGDAGDAICTASLPVAADQHRMQAAPRLHGVHGLLAHISHTSVQRPLATIAETMDVGTASLAGIVGPTEARACVRRDFADIGVSSLKLSLPAHLFKNAPQEPSCHEFVRSPLVGVVDPTCRENCNPLEALFGCRLSSGGGGHHPVVDASATYAPPAFISSAGAQNNSVSLDGVNEVSCSPPFCRNCSSSPPDSVSPINTTADSTRTRHNTVLDRRAPGCEKKLLLSMADYDQKRALADKMLRMPLADKPRTPTDIWSGYGFSRSSPFWLLNEGLQHVARQDHASSDWCKSSEPTNQQHPHGFVDQSRMEERFHSRQPTNKETDVASIMDNIGELRKYSGLFRDADISVHKFITMTETEILALGVLCATARTKLSFLQQILDSDSSRCSAFGLTE